MSKTAIVELHTSRTLRLDGWRVMYRSDRVIIQRGEVRLANTIARGAWMAQALPTWSAPTSFECDELQAAAAVCYCSSEMHCDFCTGTRSIPTTEQAIVSEVGIPYRLAFRAGTSGREFVYKGASDAAGDAGWTVRHVPRERVLETLREIPESAWCPGTYRLAAEFGFAAVRV